MPGRRTIGVEDILINRHFSIRTACLAMLLVAMLVGAMASGIFAGAEILREPVVENPAAPATLPEIVVTAPRIEDRSHR